jgi:hypothetical protein
LGNCGLLEGPDDYNTTVAKYNQQNGERERERERERRWSVEVGRKKVLLVLVGSYCVR